MAEQTQQAPAGAKLTIPQEMDKLGKSAQKLKETVNKLKDKVTPILRRDQTGKGAGGLSPELAAQLREAKQSSPMLENLLLQDEKMSETQNTLDEILSTVDF